MEHSSSRSVKLTLLTGVPRGDRHDIAGGYWASKRSVKDEQ